MFSKTKFKTVPETLHFQLVVTWGQREGINHIVDTSFPKAAQPSPSNCLQCLGRKKADFIHRS